MRSGGDSAERTFGSATREQKEGFSTGPPSFLTVLAEKMPIEANFSSLSGNVIFLLNFVRDVVDTTYRSK